MSGQHRTEVDTTKPLFYRLIKNVVRFPYLFLNPNRELFREFMDDLGVPGNAVAAHTEGVAPVAIFESRLIWIPHPHHLE